MLAVITFVLSLFTGSGSPNSAALASADDLFLHMRYPSAISAYEELLRADSDNPQILWRLARTYVLYGESYEDTRRKDLCLQAEHYARRCIAIDSTVAEAHTWLAGALGYIALHEGAQKQSALSYEILDEADKALRLNPRDDAAYSIKGSLYRALGNVGWIQRRMASIFFGGVPDGGFEEAEAALKKAAAIAPDVMRHWYELGVLYLDWGRKQEAQKAFERAALLPVRVMIDVPRLEKTKRFLQVLQEETTENR